MRTLELAAKHAPHLVALRRALHEIPETGLDLPLTQETVLRALEGLDLEVSTGESLSSVVAVLRGGGAPEGVDRRAVLLRGDMDALPVTEDVDLPYRSRHEGRMHACGHDLHAAALVGAARILAEMREEVAGDVVFMFQPAEEGPGGARRMLEEGLLELAGPPVEAAYALHVSSSEYPRGHWYARPGVLMAAVDRVNIRVQGAGGHGSEPHRALDPIPVLCEIVLALQTMVTRTFDPFDSVVLTVGKISAGFSDNVIPDSGDLAATLRTFSAQTRETAGKAIGRVASGVAAAHGLSVELDYSESYPATVNDDEEYHLAVRTVVDLFGESSYSEMPHPEMGSEDMSFVFEQVPGAYLFLGACPGDDYASAPDNHSPLAAFDDSVVPDAAAWLAEVALRRLRHPRSTS
ncbi:MAG TPA: M20 family metallopeptidase [Nocardioidaceae bacterium]